MLGAETYRPPVVVHNRRSCPQPAPGPTGRRGAGRRIPVCGGGVGAQGAVVVSVSWLSLAAPPTTTDRRLEISTAVTMISTATIAMTVRTGVLASSPTERATTAGAMSSATRFITLIS